MLGKNEMFAPFVKLSGLGEVLPERRWYHAQVSLNYSNDPCMFIKNFSFCSKLLRSEQQQKKMASQVLILIAYTNLKQLGPIS